MKTSEDKWLSPQQAAQELGVSPAIIYRSVQRDDLPHIRLSARTIRIPRSAIDPEKRP